MELMWQITLGVHMVQVGDMDVRRCTNCNSTTGAEPSCTSGTGVRVVTAGVMRGAHMSGLVVRYRGNGYPTLAVRMAQSDYWVT